MQIVFAVIGYILLFLLFIIILLLAMPVRLITIYENEKFTTKAQVLFLTFKIYPMTKKQKKEVKKAEKQGEEQAEKEVKKAKKKLNISLFAEDIVEIVQTAGSVINKIIKSMTFKNVSLVLPVHKDDAAQTAIAYGNMNAYISGAIATLHNYLQLNIKKVNIICDYDNTFEKDTYFYCKIGATPIIILIVAVYAVIRLKKNNVL